MSTKAEQIMNLLKDFHNGPPGTRIVGSFGPIGEDKSFYGIADEDIKVWSNWLQYRNAESIQEILKAKKYHLLTKTIGDPTDKYLVLIEHGELAYGNTILHSQTANTYDGSILKPSKANQVTFNKGRKTTDYLLRFYELQLKNAEKNEQSGDVKTADEQRQRVSMAISTLDKFGKTPLLLACKTANESFALRLLALDTAKTTINIADKEEQRTPLHIACILGLKELAEKLIALGADINAKDKYGNTPFTYLELSPDKKQQEIRNVLASVDFFYGHNFGPEDKEKVFAILFENNQALSKILVKMPEQDPTVEPGAAAAEPTSAESRARSGSLSNK